MADGNKQITSTLLLDEPQTIPTYLLLNATIAYILSFLRKLMRIIIFDVLSLILCYISMKNSLQKSLSMHRNTI